MVRPHSSYRLSRLAQADLDSIYDYTRQNWSIKQANRYYAELMDGFKALAIGSKRGHDAELGYGVMKVLIGSHMIFYQIGNHDIDIVRILHKAMDAPRHLQP